MGCFSEKARMLCQILDLPLFGRRPLCDRFYFACFWARICGHFSVMFFVADRFLTILFLPRFGAQIVGHFLVAFWSVTIFAPTLGAPRSALFEVFWDLRWSKKTQRTNICRMVPKSWSHELCGPSFGHNAAAAKNG